MRTFSSSHYTILVTTSLILSCVVNIHSSSSSSSSNSTDEPRGGLNSSQGEQKEDDYLEPTVLVAVLVRNKAHTLPYFLSLLEQQDYPKDRMAIWIRSDHNEDASPEILRTWAGELEAKGIYNSISVETVDAPPYRQSDQTESSLQWTEKRFRHLIRQKEAALRIAKKIWVDYVWFLDADAFIMNNQTLRHLISKKKDLVAPMLVSGGMYSNFWGGMQDDYYYVRTDEYKEILDRKKIGCFPVPMIHSSVLINVRKKVVPNFAKVNESVPEDDIILFATNAKSKNITMEICNDLQYGFILAPLDEKQDPSQDLVQMANLRVEIASYWPNNIEVVPRLSKWIQKDPKKTTIGFDKVFVINLKRRPDRLVKMINVLQILGIEYELVEATDGKNLTQEALDEMGIKQLPEYRDPYSKRLVTFGEIGCFLSHYRIWTYMLKHGVRTAIILEDDIRFEPYFVPQVERLFQEAADLNLDWDLLYLGRKRSVDAKEPWVEGSSYIVHVDYSYWTLGYAITARGAKKLVDAKPLSKLVPVDEFLPIMFDRHINHEWKAAYPNRDLKAFSAEPLLLYPTHYTGEPGYISDTEVSVPIPVKQCNVTKEEL